MEDLTEELSVVLLSGAAADTVAVVSKLVCVVFAVAVDVVVIVGIVFVVVVVCFAVAALVVVVEKFVPY